MKTYNKLSILVLLSLCALSENMHAMVRRVATVTEQKVERRFFNSGQRAAQFAQNRWQKMVAGVTVLGATAYACNESLKNDKLEALVLDAESLREKPKFKKSKEEEFEDLQNLIKNFVDTFIKQAQLQGFSDKELEKLKAKDFVDAVRIRICSLQEKEISFSELLEQVYLPVNEERKTPLCVKDIISQEKVGSVCFLFEELKKRMNIPEEVRLVGLKDNAEGHGHYNRITRVVAIKAEVLCAPMIGVLFSLIHELTHCQQHMRNDLGIGDSFENEREADTQAILAIKCPSCAQEIVNYEQRLDDCSIQGYLTINELAAYQKNKCKEDLCNFHKPKIWYEPLACEVERRLSTVRFEDKK